MNNIKKIFSAVLVCILLVSFNAHAEPMENISFADINEVMSYANEYVTWEDLQKLIDVYNRLPDIVRSKLQLHGAKIYVYPKKFETNQDIKEQTVGLTRSLTKQVTVYNNGSYTISELIPPECYIYSDKLSVVGGIPLVHEIGHIIDDLHSLDNIESSGASGSEEFSNLSVKYKNVIVGYDKAAKSNVYNNNEIYAEAFRIMFENPVYLYQNAPELYLFMINSIYY